MIKKRIVNKWLYMAVAAGLIASSGQPAVSQEKAAGKEAGQKDGGKLIKLATLEQAFVRSLQNRQQLGDRLAALVQAFQKEEDEQKKEQLRAEVEKTNLGLESLKVAMEVIFGIGNRREYEYVGNTIYLKVGTV